MYTSIGLGIFFMLLGTSILLISFAIVGRLLVKDTNEKKGEPDIKILRRK